MAYFNFEENIILYGILKKIYAKLRICNEILAMSIVIKKIEENLIWLSFT